MPEGEKEGEGEGRENEAATEQQQELVASNVFGSVVMYTPRGVHGGADDERTLYPIEKVRLPSLAASAREATELNEKADAEANKRHDDWLHGRCDFQQQGATAPVGGDAA